MIKIKNINLKETSLDLKNPFKTSQGLITSRKLLLLELIDSDGFSIWSECVAFEDNFYSDETIGSCKKILKKEILPLILDREFLHPSEIHYLLDEKIKGNKMAKAAVEMGCWALAAQKQGASLAKLLGGTQEKIHCSIAIGIQSSCEELIAKVRDALKQEYKRIKIKIKPGLDIELVSKMREKLGNGFPLSVDANQAYSINDMPVLKEMDQYNLLMIEQPFKMDAWDEHAALQKSIKTPICLDESISSLDDVKKMHQIKAGKIVNLKPGRVGGFTEALRIHDYCLENNISLWCGGMLESGIGRAYNIALASLPGFTVPGDISPSNRYWQKDIVEPEWQMDKNGKIKVPFAKIGLGVTMNFS